MAVSEATVIGPLTGKLGKAVDHASSRQYPSSKRSHQTPWTTKTLFAALGVALFLLFRVWTRIYNAEYVICSKDTKRIYTVDEKNTVVQCLVVDRRNGIVKETGDLDAVQRGALFKRRNIKFIPPGAIVVPGLSDSHVHLLEYGQNKILPLEDARSISEVVQRVQEYILANPDVHHNKSKIIQGWGWDHTIWPPTLTGWPTSSVFNSDPITKDRQIVLQSKDGHAIWVSDSTLSANSPFPETVDGGVILRDEEGNPTGVFLDDAQALIAIPEKTEEDLKRFFDLTIKDCLMNGLTSVHDAGFTPTSLAFFKREAERRKLPIRIYGMSFFHEDTEYWGDKSEPLLNVGGGRLTARSVKMYADGALRTGGAALYEPYADNPSSRGFMRLSNHTLEHVVPRFLKDGWQVNIHAIGDRANGLVLDAFEKALAVHSVEVSSLRPRLEHAQIMTPEDVERLGRLGVIASVQPTHAIDDMWFAEDRLGPERIKNLYAFRSILNSNARITLGSDFPVESVNPLAGFYAAITRTDYDGKSPQGRGGWFPEQRLTREETLRGMTIDPAYASFSEDTLGSLEPGKRADFVVLSRDIMNVAPKDILETKVLATVIDGEVVYTSMREGAN